MDNVHFVTIDTAAILDNHRVQLEKFFASLDSERTFFTYLNMAYVQKSDFFIAAFDNEQIIGVAGVETTHLFAHKAYVLVKNEYQFGLGAFLSLKRNHEARKRYNFIILKINPNNTASQQMNRALGYKVLGRRFADDYLMMPFNRQGLGIYYLLKIIMPLVNIYDLVFPPKYN